MYMDELERYMIRARRMRSEYIAQMMREGIVALLHVIGQARRAAAHALRSAYAKCRTKAQRAAPWGAPHSRKEDVMNHLTLRERELVALGSAMGSNCVPCIEHHIPEARKAGLTDSQISEAIRGADRVRQVPARRVLAVALKMLAETSAGVEADEDGCVPTAPTTEAGARCCG